MKPIKAFFTGCLILCSTFAFSQAAEKTLVKAFNLQGNSAVVLDLPGNVEVKQWDNTIMRVQMAVTLENGSNSMLKSLITAGRFNLKSKVENEEFFVYSPSMHKKVTVSGVELAEKVTYTVFVPNYVIVRLNEAASTNVEQVKTKSSSSL